MVRLIEISKPAYYHILHLLGRLIQMQASPQMLFLRVVNQSYNEQSGVNMKSKQAEKREEA